jgi:hypothetical protein
MADMHDDRDFHFDPRNLFPQWDSAAQRFGYLHPNKPSVQALGFAATFMGWTLAGAQEMCRLENIRLRPPVWRRAASPS